MKLLIAVFLLVGLTSVVDADDKIKDYVGPFSTMVLYSMCSQNDRIPREKCNMYIQGLIYALNVQRSMHEKSATVCLPEMTVEVARLRMIEFIDGTTQGKPQSNKDGGDWMAFMGLAAGNLCKN